MPKNGSIHARAARGNNHTVAIEPSAEVLAIEQSMKDLAEHLKVARTRDRYRAELRDFLKRRPLITRKVLRAMIDELPDDRPKRGKKAVKSRKVSMHNRPKPQNAKIAAAIQKGREAKGLSRTELAEKLGVHGSNITWWEGAKGKPSDEVWPKIERVLGVKLPPQLQLNGHTAP
jgi:ribosome-binding protein aMBF1 (putative translation factor)